MKIVLCLLALTAAVANAGFIGTLATPILRDREINAVSGLLQVIFNAVLGRPSQVRNQLSVDNTPAIVAGLHAGGSYGARSTHGGQLLPSITAGIVASLHAGRQAINNNIKTIRGGQSFGGISNGGSISFGGRAGGYGYVGNPGGYRKTV